MLHFHRTDIEGAKKLLLEYLEAGDYSRPFILAGRCYIGKSAMIRQVRSESNIGFDTFVLDPEDNTLESAKMFISGTCPRVLEVACGQESLLRNVVKAGCHVAFITTQLVTLAPFEDKLRVDTKAVTDYDGDNWEELAERIYGCADLILFLYLLKEEAAPAATALLDALKAQAQKNPMFASNIEAEIKDIREVFAEELV